MEVASYIVIFILIWWLVLFMTLPFGVEMHGENKDGNLPAAPKKHNLKKKMLLTTVIAFFLSIVASYLIQSNIMDFRGKADQMFEEDMNR